MSDVIQEYIVRRPFKYAGIFYEPGQRWEPVGSRYDKSLIENRFVEKRLRSESVEASDADALMEKTNQELREMLKERELPVYGTKQELVERLTAGEPA